MIAILCQTLNSAVIYIGYSLNKDYITKTFCVNKNKPAMHCNGMCHMMKEIKEHEQKESSPIGLIKEKLETLTCFSISPLLRIYQTHFIKLNYFYNTKLSSGFLSSPLQPPQV